MAAAQDDRIEPAPDRAEEDLADVVDDTVPGRNYSTQPLVGLGGSAGSLSALQSFFSATAPDSGLSFVVVMHLAPDHESALAEILQRSTTMPVLQVADSAPVHPNHVYVIPPGKVIASANGRLHCTSLTPGRGRRLAIDLFFRSLADTHGPHATAIVLSGADGDGAIGIKRVKERGGLTIAQDPVEAEHESMPRAAIATGMVDWVLRVGEMPERIRHYIGLLARVELPPESGPQPAALPRGAGDDAEQALHEVLLHLHTQCGHDFSYYKRATIVRRLRRRVTVNGLPDLRAYLAFLRTHPGEVGALLQDLLISVTNFFRDRDAFDALQLRLAGVMAHAQRAGALRVWVPACATGEEAYSIAMLLAEHAALRADPPRIQVFATDLDAQAIRVAREGLYPAAIAADLSEERLRRFFVADVRGYRVRTELRESVLFATHDLLKDAPFSRIDVLSCRNLMIYLDRDAQQRALQVAHFAMRPGGVLFLGASETVEGTEALFSVLDKRHRIYEARAVPRAARLPVPDAIGLVARSRELQERQPLAPEPAPWRVPGLKPNPTLAGAASWRELHLKMIERFAPPSIVVTAEHEIVHLSERAGRFLHVAGGEPSTNLLALIQPDLAVDLRTALARLHGATPVRTEPIPFRDGDAPATVVITVAGADDFAPGFILVTFDVRDEDAAAPRAGEGGRAASDERERLLRQVEDLKGHLRETVEQSRDANHDLRASNEELQAMNEELRSATEELETSREELQSINEEMTTVNSELKTKVDELARANGDLRNLMAATEIAAVFLDRALHITLFTPSAVALFNLIASDVGRPLADLASRLDYPQLIEDATAVLAQLAPVEREVRFGDRWLFARVLPYRSADDHIAGVVLTFLDITVRRQAEDALRGSERQFRVILSQSAAGVAHTDLDGTITLCNPRYAQIAGRSEDALVGMSVFDLVHPDDRERNVAAFRRMVETGKPFEMEKRYLRPDGGVVNVSTAVTTTTEANGTATGAVAIVLDITQSEETQRALRESQERLELIVENAREFAIVSLDLDRRVTSWNIGAREITGYHASEIVGQSADILFIEEDRVAGAPAREARLALTEGRAADERWHRRRDGSRFWGSGVMTAMRAAGGGTPIGFVKIFRDQTQARAAAQALETSRAELVQALVDNRKARAEVEAASHAKDRFLAILSHELRTPLTPIVMALHALERNPELPASARTTVELMRRNVRAELTLIDDLLDVTRISSGKLEIVAGRADMHEVVRAAVAVCESDVAAKRQRLEVELGAARSAVAGDAARLQQVVWNLLKNASKFTPPDGEIRIATSNVGDRFVLVVADSGIGIAPEALPTIFDAFAQEGAWVTSEFGGLGLGLAIAKATVEAHHGTLTAASGGRDRGATFTIELPLD